MEDQKEELMRLRDKIDRIDGKILELISSRATVAQEVGRVKEVAGVANALFYRPEREAQVLRRIIACNEGPLDDEKMARLFREIMSACLAMEDSASEEGKTSIVVSMRNQVDSLHRLLAPFHYHDIDLTRIERRPLRSGVCHYLFFIDFIGHRDDSRVQSVLKKVKAFVSDLKVLGSYPKGVL